MEESNVKNSDEKITVKTFVVFGIRCYQRLISPFLGNCCRFYPSCSQYAIEAIQSHGAMKGFLYSFLRIIRCHPGCHGGWDPVPERKHYENIHS